MFKVAILLLMLGMMPASAAETSVVPGEEHCVVNVPSWDRLNIRSAPSSQSSLVVRKRYGTCGIMVVGNCRGQWCPVEDGHSVGWVNRRFISMVSPSLNCTAKRAEGRSVSIRAYPSPQSRLLVSLNRHTCGIAFLPYRRSNWQKIRVDGWEDWINRADVSGQ